MAGAALRHRARGGRQAHVATSGPHRHAHAGRGVRELERVALSAPARDRPRRRERPLRHDRRGAGLHARAAHGAREVLLARTLPHAGRREPGHPRGHSELWADSRAVRAHARRRGRVPPAHELPLQSRDHGAVQRAC